MSFQTARDVSSVLVGEQRWEDLASQGANREARRRTVLRNWILERLSSLTLGRPLGYAMIFAGFRRILVRSRFVSCLETHARIWFAMLSAVFMPHVVGLLLVAAIFVAKSCDMISGQNVGDAIQDRSSTTSTMRVTSLWACWPRSFGLSC